MIHFDCIWSYLQRYSTTSFGTMVIVFHGAIVLPEASWNARLTTFVNFTVRMTQCSTVTSATSGRV